MNTLIFAQLLDEHQYSEPLTSLIEAVVDSRVFNPLKRNEIMENIEFDMDAYKNEACDAVFHYAEKILDDHVLTAEEWQTINFFKAYLQLEEEDFLNFHKEEEIKHLLQTELRRICQDDVIDAKEGIMASEMQGLFGLSATMYGEFMDEIMQEALKRGADRIDLIQNI